MISSAAVSQIAVELIEGNADSVAEALDQIDLACAVEVGLADSVDQEQYEGEIE